MKKVAVISVIIVVVLLIAAGSVLYWKRLAPPAMKPETLLPPETLLLVEASDLPRFAIRWQATELNKLWQEPEVQAFMEKPLATHPALARAAQMRKDLIKLWPRQLFAAVVSMDGANPKLIGGFSYAGDGKTAEKWLADARRTLKNAHPAGKAELVMHGKIGIETYTDNDFVLAESTHGGWHFAANDLALLKATLDRVDAGAKGTAPSLAGDADYQKAFARLPTGADLRVFARTGVFTDRLLAAAAAGDSAKNSGLDALRKTRALAAISKLEGGQIHDAVFKLGDGEPKQEVLARTALELTDPETAAFASLHVGALDASGLPPEYRGLIPFFSSLEAALKVQGATVADLPAIFGPEVSLVMPKTKSRLSGVLALGLRDGARAAGLAEALASPALGEQAWVASDEDGQRIYTAPADGVSAGNPPVVTVTERYWLLSNTPSSFAPLANRGEATPQIDHTASYRELAGAVAPPTRFFGYVDLGALFETYYTSLRSLLAFGLLGDESGQYFDAAKLPNAPVLSRHLGRLVLSQAAVPEGTLWESRGHVSLGQLLLGGAAGYLATGSPLPAVPALPAAVAVPVAPLPPIAPAAPVSPDLPSATPPPATPAAPTFPAPSVPPTASDTQVPPAPPAQAPAAPVLPDSAPAAPAR